MDCIFCKIVAREIPSPLLYEDSEIIAFNDITPKAPHHILIIPKAHIATLNDAIDTHQALLGKMMLVAKQLAHELGVAEDGYRVLMNCNEGGGQAVFHIHLHLLAGRQMHWPPG
jgi:histidine triad (HIT) family protein